MQVRALKQLKRMVKKSIASVGVTEIEYVEPEMISGYKAYIIFDETNPTKVKRILVDKFSRDTDEGYVAMMHELAHTTATQSEYRKSLLVNNYQLTKDVKDLSKRNQICSLDQNYIIEDLIADSIAKRVLGFINAGLPKAIEIRLLDNEIKRAMTMLYNLGITSAQERIIKKEILVGEQILINCTK
jgi:hypothetical protein